MNTTTAVVGTAALTVAGKWAQEKPIDLRIAVGGAVLAMFMSVLNKQNPEIAGKLGLAILLTTAFMYGPAIADKTGLTKPREEKK